MKRYTVETSSHLTQSPKKKTKKKNNNNNIYKRIRKTMKINIYKRESRQK